MMMMKLLWLKMMEVALGPEAREGWVVDDDGFGLNWSVGSMIMAQ